MPLLRPAAQTDLPALRDIYNHYVIHTPNNFDVEPRTLAQRQEWFDQFAPSGKYRCFVAEEGGQAIAFACSSRFKEKKAYETTIETSVYCAEGCGGKGIGKKLYAALFEALKGEDIHRAYAGITLPNEASVRLHLSAGFRLVGTYPQIGRKFGKYWDVAHYIRDMG
jgi:phosphinothricin acetyltransferase